MPSPFPGMNPYLEQEDVWQDFHQSFIPLLRESLSEQVRPSYIVKVEEHLFVHELPGEERRLLGRSDLSVAKALDLNDSGRATAVIEAPSFGELPIAEDIEHHAYLEIRDRRSRELVTVLELLSPANKRSGPDRQQYLAKRMQFTMSGIHLVELDLLRGGPRLPIDGLQACAYYILVSRAEERPRVGLWHLGLRDPLPTIPIPLREPDPDARLNLQDLLQRQYDAAGYDDYIYDGQPQPPLEGDEEAWARELLQAHLQTG